MFRPVLLYSSTGGRRNSKFVLLDPHEHGHVHSDLDTTYPLTQVAGISRKEWLWVGEGEIMIYRGRGVRKKYYFKRKYMTRKYIHITVTIYCFMSRFFGPVT